MTSVVSGGSLHRLNWRKAGAANQEMLLNCQRRYLCCCCQFGQLHHTADADAVAIAVGAVMLLVAHLLPPRCFLLRTFLFLAAPHQAAHTHLLAQPVPVSELVHLSN